MDNKKIAEELWELLWITFDSHADNQKPRTGGGPFQGPTNDLQNRMVPKLVKLKQGNINQELINSLIGDYNLCHATGWMTDETYKKSIELIGRLG